MGEELRLGEILREHMRRPETFSSIGILSKRSGVPKATIANWLGGRVERPRHYMDLVKVAAALHLGAREAGELLAAAGYPPLSELHARAERADERDLLARWLVARPEPQASQAPARPALRPQPQAQVEAAGPAVPTLVGRAEAVAATGQLLLQPEVQLVTLTGPGGVGKTSLARNVAASLGEQFADGQRWVELTPLSAPELVLATVARALGLAETIGAGAASDLERLVGALRDRQLLLLLDNFEQVVAAGPLLGALLAACPRLKALVTSREALRIPAEHELCVPSLALPPAALAQALPEPGDIGPLQLADLARCPAIDLFVTRARAAQSGFALSEANAADVAAICRQLDGLPLAIELAAARVRLLPTAALRERLCDEGGANALRLLSESRSDLPARQHTLRDTIAWSYRLLAPAEQRLFRRLAVFVGGFTPEAAEAVAGLGDGTLDELTSLVNKSLVRRPAPADGQGRLALLETIRAFGLEQLTRSGELAAVQHRHAQYFLALVEQGEPALRGPQQDRWIERLAPDLDNVRAALDWGEATARAGGSGAGAAAVLGVRLAGVVWRFGVSRGYLNETRRWLERAMGTLQRLVRAGQPGLAGAPGLGQARLAWAKALIGIAMVARIQGDLEQATAYLDEGFALGEALDDQLIIADALISLGNVTWLQDDLDRTEALFTRSLALYSALGDEMGAIWSLNGLGNVSLRRRDYARADRLLQEGLNHARRAGFKRLTAWSLTNRGSMALEQGDLGRAEALLSEGLVLLRALHDRQGIAQALYRLGVAASQRDDFAGAAACFEESLALRRDLGDQQGSQICAQCLADNAARAEARAASPADRSVPRARPAPRQAPARPCGGLAPGRRVGLRR